MDSNNPLTCESEIKFYLLMIRYRKITEGSYYLLMSYIKRKVHEKKHTNIFMCVRISRL